MVSQVNQFYIKEIGVPTNRKLLFHYAKSASDNITFGNVTMNQPGQSSDQNFGILIGGAKRMITIDFVLRDDGSDKSAGTGTTTSGFASTAITLTKQWEFLMKYVVQVTGSSQFSSGFEICIYSDGAPWYISGLIENISVKWSDDGTSLIGNLTLTETKV